MFSNVTFSLSKNQYAAVISARPPQAAGMLSSLLKNSTGCDVAGMRRQNNDVSRYFASRAKLCFALGEVEKCHEGIFQQTVSVGRTANCESTNFNRSVIRLSFKSADFISSLTHGASIGYHPCSPPQCLDSPDRHHAPPAKNLQCQHENVCNNEGIAPGCCILGRWPKRNDPGQRRACA